MSDEAEVTDTLERDQFLTALLHHIDDIAAIPLRQLPAPRVLAVDAPWGYGKSWVANKLVSQLKAVKNSDEKPRAVAFIDAFRYDHHEDVFAVIAAAVMSALHPDAKKKRKYIAAATQVLKSSAPAVVKGLGNLAVKGALGLAGLDEQDLSETMDSIKDAALDKGAKFSEKAVEQLFDKYAKAKELQEDFQNSLNEITKDLDKPFVVVIDELDRCRPSFALEVLERVKHLFSAEKVVFVMFWNSQSIHESIKHQYGRYIPAEEYLSKFVALTIPLPLPYRRDVGPSAQYATFVERELDRVCPQAVFRAPFEHTLIEVATAFNASLRDVQKAIQLYKPISLRPPGAFSPVEFAYLALLKVTNEQAFKGLAKGDPDVARTEAARLRTSTWNLQQPGPLEQLWAALEYLADKPKYLRNHPPGQNEETDFIIATLEIARHGGKRDELTRSALFLRFLLTTPQPDRQAPK